MGKKNILIWANITEIGYVKVHIKYLVNMLSGFLIGFTNVRFSKSEYTIGSEHFVVY